MSSNFTHPLQSTILRALLGNGLCTLESLAAEYSVHGLTRHPATVHRWAHGQRSAPAAALLAAFDHVGWPDAIRLLARMHGMVAAEIPQELDRPITSTSAARLSKITGDLGWALITATAPDGDGGDKVTEAEAIEALDKLEAALDELHGLRASLMSSVGRKARQERAQRLQEVV